MYFAAKIKFISALKRDFGDGFNVEFALTMARRTLNWRRDHFRHIIKSLDPDKSTHYHIKANCDPKVWIKLVAKVNATGEHHVVIQESSQKHKASWACGFFISLFVGMHHMGEN